MAPINKLPVIVSHSGKQYVHRLIQALLENGEAVIFCTPLWWQNPPRWIKMLPDFLRKRVHTEIRKRSFLFKGKIQLIRRPAIAIQKEIIERLPFGDTGHEQFKFENRHDAFAATVVNNYPGSLVIGYEISSVATFRQAKKKGCTTVLDLAQIHYKAIAAISRQFEEMEYIERDPDLSNIEARKQQEYELADFIITLSSYARQTMLEQGIPEDKLYEVHLGFDVQLFNAKEEYNKSGPLKLMICGTDMVRKGLGLLIKVLHDMESQGFKLQLTVVGPMGDIENVLKKSPRISSLLCIPFLAQEELVALYQQSDLFVFPSYLDSWAMTVLEAMACGTPVIVTENTGSKDAVKKGGGMIIPVGDANALHKAIAAFYHNRPLLEETGKKAREVAMEYTWENYYHEVGQVIADIYRKSTGNNRKIKIS